MPINSTKILTLWKNILISLKSPIWDLSSPQSYYSCHCNVSGNIGTILTLKHNPRGCGHISSNIHPTEIVFFFSTFTKLLKKETRTTSVYRKISSTLEYLHIHGGG